MHLGCFFVNATNAKTKETWNKTGQHKVQCLSQSRINNENYRKT